MRVLVAAAFPAGSHDAHAIHTVKMAQGFARLGHQVRIVCRRPRRLAGREPRFLAQQYGIREPVEWTQLSWAAGERRLFACGAALVASRFRPALVYARNYAAPVTTSGLGWPTVVETHAHPDNRSKPFLRLMRASGRTQLRRVVTISAYLARHYRRLGVPRSKTLVLPDAVDLELFGRPTTLPPSPYPPQQLHVVYAGHLYDYKGIPTILAAAGKLPEVSFHLVGGRPEDIARQRQHVRRMRLDNITVHGAKAHAQVPAFLWHADALLLVPSAQHASARWTSPVKLGEYLASGVPVVASRIVALREALTERVACFVRPDDPDDLAAAIDGLLADRQRAGRLARAAAEMAKSLSYEHRAEQILAAAWSRPIRAHPGRRAA